MTNCDKLLLNATTIDKRGREHQKQAIVIDQGVIIWCGKEEDLPTHYCQDIGCTEDCNGRLLTPGLIDCHTHLVYAGHRAEEYKLRLEGTSYAEIARRGGGILSTVEKTRQASEQVLLEASMPRLLAMRSQGVLTVEIKSGYGLDLETELKMLRVARRLQDMTGVTIFTTFLGAHALPPEYTNNSQGYIDLLCNEMLPAVAEEGLADAVDVFCESIGFNRAQTEQVFSKAQSLHLPVKCHAEQLSNMGASELSAQYHALSCDHLEYLDARGVEAMARAGTVAVLLPGAYYFLRETKKPPIDLLRQAEVGMAIATDCNPGTSPTTSLSLMMNMACQFFGLTVPEAWRGVTYEAARALGLEYSIGSLEVGMHANLIRWQVRDSAQLCYQFGSLFLHDTMIKGQWIVEDLV